MIRILSLIALVQVCSFLASCSGSENNKEATSEKESESYVDNKTDDIEKVLGTMETYDHPNRIACSISEAPGTEYDGTWDPKQNKYTGKLKVGKNGLLWQLANFKNGLKDGEELIYDDNGLLMGITDWKEGKKEGRYYQLDEKGRIILKASTKNGDFINCEGPLCP
jgi:antitoxin component YwqK of YwqJK toxin-antitoxin module